MPTKNDNIFPVSINGNGYTYSISDGIPYIELNSNGIWDLLNGKPTTKSKPNALSVRRILYHNPATIVFWQDGTKTVVKCMDGEPFEKYAGFCAALAKKVFGSTSKAKKVAGAKKKDEVAE